MSQSSKISRRSVLTAGAGIAAGVVTATAMGGAAPLTPANPEGPFYPQHEQLDRDTDLTLIRGHAERAQGQVVRVSGRVLDDQGQAVAGALVDIWQANALGRYAHEDDPATAPLDPNFQGWGMVKTDADGRYSFTTIKPGAYAVSSGWSRPPHIHFRISRRGYHELTTQMYFADESLNEKDRLLLSVDEEARKRLVVDFHDTDGVLEGDFPIVLARVI
ncbi:MAG: protocatechuate 3,4-dioxygenase [Xanthomonadales bacterium]